MISRSSVQKHPIIIIIIIVMIISMLSHLCSCPRCLSQHCNNGARRSGDYMNQELICKISGGHLALIGVFLKLINGGEFNIIMVCCE